MKNIVIVAMNNVSVAVVVNNGANKYQAKTASNNKLALLENIKSALSGIPTNDNTDTEIRQIIVGSKSPVIGLVAGTWRQYIRTGKTAKGNEIPADELALWTDIANLYAERCFNVQFTSDQFIGKNDRATKDLINCAWELVKQEVRKANNMPQAQAPQVAQPQANPAVVKLQELMAKALEEGDLDKYDALEERLNRLTGAPSQAQAPVVEEDVLGDTSEVDFE